MAGQRLAGTPDPDSGAPAPGLARVVTVAAAVQGTSMLPMFLTGAMAVQIRADLGFGAAALGVATGSFVLARAVASVPLGRTADRLGALRSMRLSAAGGILIGLGTAAFVSNWATLVVALATAGTVQAITQPAANRFVARFVPPTRLGLAFGLKQSGPPIMTILAGAAVPMLALTVGWRWAFVAVAVLGVVTLMAIPSPGDRRPERPSRTAAGDGPVELGMVMVGMFFALAAINAMQTFVVTSAVDNGVAPGIAGLMLAVGGGTAVVVRILAGQRADRRGGGHFGFVRRMLLAGAGGYLLLAVGWPWLYVPAAVFCYGSIWGMNGVLFLGVVQARPHAPATASGAVIAVGSVGGFLGPVAFGTLVEWVGYRPAWLAAAVWAVVAALAIGCSEADRSAPVTGC